MIVVSDHARVRLVERLHIIPAAAESIASKAWIKGANNSKRAILRRNRTEYFVSDRHVVKEMMGRAFVFDPRPNGHYYLVTVI